jgi:ubiquinone/menaquinone biosynthesis C-methylase UbiE
MSSQSPDLQEIKSRMKASWMAGDFGVIARMNEKWGEEFVDRLGLKPGMKVLDVACGTGNQSLPAARKGAEVTGLDIATNLLEQARTRAAAEGLKINFIEGDAEELPFADATFDVVYSMFGAMFAPRPDRVAAELKRVCKPGGLIAMANWTPQGVPGQIFAVTSKYLPPAPGLLPPSFWGVEKIARERFGNDVDLKAEKIKVVAKFEQTPAGVVALFREYFGPTKTTFARLDPEAQQHLAADIEQVFANANYSREGGTEHDSEYLEVHARKKS